MVGCAPPSNRGGNVLTSAAPTSQDQTQSPPLLKSAIVPSGLRAPTLTTRDAVALEVLDLAARVGEERCGEELAAGGVVPRAGDDGHAAAAEAFELMQDDGIEVGVVRQLVVVPERQGHDVDRRRPAGREGVVDEAVQHVEGPDQVTLLDDAVGGHHPDRPDVGLRADLPDQAGDEGPVAGVGVQRTVHRPGDVTGQLGVGVRIGLARVDDLAVDLADDIADDAVLEPRVLAAAGVEHRDDGAPAGPVRLVVGRLAEPRHGCPASGAGHDVLREAVALGGGEAGDVRHPGDREAGHVRAADQ